MSKNTKVAVIETSTAPAIPQEALDLFRQDAALAPQFAPDEKAMPWLRIAQSMTPQAKRTDPSYIEGLSEGDFFTVLTRRRFDGADGLLFLPAYYTRNYTHWKPRTAGGGIIKNFGADRRASGVDDAVRNPETNKLMVGDVEVVESMMYYGFIVDPTTGDFEDAVLSLASTQLGKGRKWNTLMQSQRVGEGKEPVPIFGRTYHLTTTTESKDRYTWAGLKVDPGPWIMEIPSWHVLYHGAKQVHAAFTTGERIMVADDAEIIDFPIATPQTPKDERDYVVDDDAE